MLKNSILSIFVIFFLVSSSFSLTANNTESLEDNQELVLLFGEIAVYLYAHSDETNPFNFIYSIPPIYEDQIPILIELRNDTTIEIIRYHVDKDVHCPNLFLNFTCAPMSKGEKKFLHFTFWVLVNNTQYSGNFPQYVPLPSKEELPEDTLIWLTSTKAIQSKNILIQLKARQLQGRSDNLIEVSENIVEYTSSLKIRQRLWNFLLLISPNKYSGWAKYLDAVSALFIGGSCTARANLGTALFRAIDIPAKNLLVMPAWVGFTAWYDMHYTCEYYCPGYGWVLTETSIGVTPFPRKYQIILRINYPEDENHAGNRFDYYGGCEQWFWLNAKNIRIWWNNNDSGARSWSEQALFVDSTKAKNCMELTKNVYELHTKYLGIDLGGANQQHFENAVAAQKNAIDLFKQLDIDGYILSLSNSIEEYLQINEVLDSG